MLSLRLSLSFPATRPHCRREPHGPGQQSHGVGRSIRVEEIEAIPGFVRAGRPRSRGTFSPDGDTKVTILRTFGRCHSRILIVSLLYDPPGTAGVASRTVSGRPSCSFVVRLHCPKQNLPTGYPPLHHGRHPPGARASRPHAVPSVIAQFPCDAAPGHTAGGNRMGPAEAEPWRRCRSIRVEEMGEAIPGFVRAGRPRSRGTFSPDVVTPTSQYCRSIRAPLVIEGAPSVFVPIRVHSWFVFISKTKTAGCFSSV